MTAYTCDTSVLVAAIAAWHPDHRSARVELQKSVRAVPTHVLLECYSVLTRLPAPHRVSPGDAGAVLAGLDLVPIALPPKQHLALVPRLAREGIRGGATYDALIAATAAHHGLDLLTRDRRARSTYDALGVSYRLM